MPGPSDPPSAPGSAHPIVFGVACVAILARLAVMAQTMGAPLADPDNYLPLARAVAAGDGLSFAGRATAYRPPLYPILLAAGLAIPGIGPTAWVLGLHLALGTATAVLAAVAARRWGLSPASIAIAGLVVACDPVLVIQARSVMTETLAAFLVAAALAVARPEPTLRNAVALGGLLGLAALCRPSLLPVAPLAALALACVPAAPSRRLMLAATLLVATFATLSPWAIRNARLYGEPVWTTTHGGYTLALANNTAYYDDVVGKPSGVTWTGPNQRRWFETANESAAGLDEPKADRRFRDQALSTIRARPADFARATLERLARFWAIAPSSDVYSRPVRLAVAAWTAPLWVALAFGLASALRRTAWPETLALAFLAALTAVHALYWTDLRMRAPIVPAAALIAALPFSTRYMWMRRPHDARPEAASTRRSGDFFSAIFAVFKSPADAKLDDSRSGRVSR